MKMMVAVPCVIVVDLSLPFLSVPLITASNWVWGGLGIVICSTRLIALSREEYRNKGIPLKWDSAKKGYR